MKMKRTAAALTGLIVLCLTPGPSPLAQTGGRTPASEWQTWHLDSADQFRLPAPPAEGSRKTRRELRELRRLQDDLDGRDRRRIKRWNTGPATLPWTDVILREIPNDTKIKRPGFSGRALAYLHTAMYDAMVAASDSRRAYAGSTRGKPFKVDPRIDPLTSARGVSSYAPVHAAVAGAAEVVLPYLFPDSPVSRFTDLATQAVESRLDAGVNYRSDVERARRLGNRVADRVLADATSDGSDATGPAHPRINDEAHWSPTPPGFTDPPVGGPVGKWDPWLMATAGELRPLIPGPSAYDSPEFLTQLAEVVEVQENLTQVQQETAFFWDDGVGTTTPPGHWFSIALELVRSPGTPGFALDTEEAARMFAYLGVTEAEATIAFYEAKYFWWSIRPVTAIWRLCDNETRLCSEDEASSDPALAPHYGVWQPVLVTPPFPSYPSGHATFSGGAGRLLTHFLPQYANSLNELADDAAMSRLYGGIHFREDNEDGLILGRAVADLAIARAEADGSGL